MGLTRGRFARAIATLGMPVSLLSASIAAAADTYTMRLAHTGPVSGASDLTARRFATAVESRTRGQLKIEVYPNGQLAKQQEAIDGLASGSIDLAIDPSTFLVQLLPQYQIFDMPFIFKDLATAYRVLDGPIGSEFFADLEPKGIVGLAWGTGGFREMETTSKPIVAPDDLKGLRMRIQAGAVYAAMFQALGAIPVTIDLSEVMTALSQHTVDGTEQPLDGFTAGKFYTVARHVAMSHHILSVQPLFGSKRKMDALPPALQRVLKEEGKTVLPYMRSLNTGLVTEDVDILKKSGVAFTDIQYPAFRKAMDPVYAGVQSKLGGNLLERVIRAAA
jgi:TRAP-type transport system periplasmic protein